jgi:hypothetical protein
MNRIALSVAAIALVVCLPNLLGRIFGDTASSSHE